MESINYLETESAAALPQLNQTFTFRGKTLAKYSWTARACFYRIIHGESVAFEQYAYLIYLLLSRTPEQMDRIRSEKDIAAFRLEAGQWAEAEGVADAGWDELQKTAEAILDAVRKARSLEPAPQPGPPRPNE